ncbi:leucine-zipper-like transcriptional regulator 1 [Anaeramoeba ignava]|uniref:Leucine-zipper-like transcriptional regulator 1 n=1 Tax=Anaeramoeba ignava TaxID=1746090 RepID=A0A9Q0L7G5_ANAIG|nr:leucine-zipper-like transcriptional regulator 1 [Anaeramoeba ignava]
MELFPITYTGEAPDERSCARSVILSDNELLFFGGINSKCYFNTFEKFDLNTYKWIKMEIKGNQPKPRSGHSMTKVENKVYILGGMNTVGFCDNGWLDLENLTWNHFEESKIRDLDLLFHSVVVYNNQMWIFGGDQKSKFTNNLSIIDTNKNQFFIQNANVKGDIPTPRSRHSAVAWHDHMWVFGGQLYDRFHHETNDMYQLDMKDFFWKKVEQFGKVPSPRRSHFALLEGDYMYLFGGCYRREIDYCDFFRFSMISNTWEEFDLLPNHPTASNHFLVNENQNRFSLQIQQEKIVEERKANTENSPTLPHGRGGCCGKIYQRKLYLCLGGYFEADWVDISDSFYIEIETQLGFDFLNFFKRQEFVDLVLSSRNHNFTFGAHKTFVQARLGSEKMHEFLTICEYSQAYNITQNDVYSFLVALYSGSYSIDSQKMLSLLKMEKFNALEDDMQKLFEDENSKDFEIIVENQSIRVHQSIMAARSELYRGMLLVVNDDSKKSPDLSGRSAEAIRVVLRYIYTGNFGSFSDSLNSELSDCFEYYGLNFD